jgi:hypothetical protein
MVAAIFKVQQRVFGAFEDDLVLLGGLSILAVSHFVDHASEAGNDVEQVEDDSGIRQFFLRP